MVTDERGQTAGLIIKVGRKMNVEVLSWDDLRINGVKMALPFQNSEMIAEVFCGIVQITTTIGFTVTMDKDGQVGVVIFSHSIFRWNARLPIIC